MFLGMQMSPQGLLFRHASAAAAVGADRIKASMPSVTRARRIVSA